MNYVVIDLEFNNLQDIEQYFSGFYKDYPEVLKSQCPNEIIEIGAVKLDKAMKIIDSFKLYVKPEIFTILNPRITEITGITEEKLIDGVSFIQALEELGRFVGQDAVVCSWAKDDIAELIRNANYYSYKSIEWLKEYIDIQEYCTKVLASKNSLSLKSALDRLRIQVDESKLHDALNDSEYTAEVFKRTLNNRIIKNYIIKDIINMPSIIIKDLENFIFDYNKLTLLCPKCKSKVNIEYPFKLFGWKYAAISSCEKCNSKILHKVVIKNTLAGEEVYSNNERVLTEEEYGDYSYKYENDKLII